MLKQSCFTRKFMEFHERYNPRYMPNAEPLRYISCEMTAKVRPTFGTGRDDPCAGTLHRPDWNRYE